MPPYRGLEECPACLSHPVCMQPPGTGWGTVPARRNPAQGRNDGLRTASRSINGVVKTKWYYMCQDRPIAPPKSQTCIISGDLYQFAVMPPYRGLKECPACHSHPVCMQPPGTGWGTVPARRNPAQGRNDGLRTASRSINGVVKTKWYYMCQDRPIAPPKSQTCIISGDLYQFAVMPPYRGLEECPACHSHPVCMQPPGTGWGTVPARRNPAQGRNDGLRTASRSINGVVKTKWY